MKFLGGSALLVFSIEGLSRHVQSLADHRFRQWVNTYSSYGVYAMLLGIVLSALLSSSTVVTVMLVGFANARLVQLPQVFAVSLGAGIGSTVLVHLMAFKFSHYALLLVAVGVSLRAVFKLRSVRSVADVSFYLGLIFFALALVLDSGRSLQEDPFFRYVIDYFQNRPFVSLMLSALIAAMIHSSAAAIAFAMSIIVGHHGTILEALPWVLGANIGTSATAFFASLPGGALGRQAALGNLLIKLFGVVVTFPLLEVFATWIVGLSPDLNRQIALAHTLFNVGLAVIFYPGIGLGVRLVRSIIEDDTSSSPFSLQYLKCESPEQPEVILAQANREITRLSDTVEVMVQRCIHLFREPKPYEIETLRRMDRLVDYLNRSIKLHLTRYLSQDRMSEGQSEKEFEFLIRTNDLENIGDLVDKNLLELVRKTSEKGYSFSSDGWRELLLYHAKVLECLRLSSAYFGFRDPGLKNTVLALHRVINGLYLELSELHVHRLHQGVKASLETTAVHLDVLGYLKRVSDISVGFIRLELDTERQDSA